MWDKAFCIFLLFYSTMYSLNCPKKVNSVNSFLGEYLELVLIIIKSKQLLTFTQQLLHARKSSFIISLNSSQQFYKIGVIISPFLQMRKVNNSSVISPRSHIQQVVDASLNVNYMTSDPTLSDTRLITYCCIINNPKISDLKQHYLVGSEDQEFKSDLSR